MCSNASACGSVVASLVRATIKRKIKATAFRSNQFRGSMRLLLARTVLEALTDLPLTTRPVDSKSLSVAKHRARLISTAE
jgi:hypothetical protein